MYNYKKKDRAEKLHPVTLGKAKKNIILFQEYNNMKIY